MKALFTLGINIHLGVSHHKWSRDMHNVSNVFPMTLWLTLLMNGSCVCVCYYICSTSDVCALYKLSLHFDCEILSIYMYEFSRVYQSF